MRHRLVFLVALLLSASSAVEAVAAQTRPGTVRRVPVQLDAGGRSLQALVQRTRIIRVRRPFLALGIHFDGPPGVRFEVRTGLRRLGRWRALRPGDAPPANGREHATQPLYVGAATKLQIRVSGRAANVTAILVDPGSEPTIIPLQPQVAVPQPEIVLRATWGADERLRQGEPRTSEVLRGAFVSSTDTAGSYRAEQVPAIIRALYLYHVRGNGWPDIGPNFLVDRFGRIYEGRFGGLARNVVGQQTRGFDAGSAGVSFIGRFTTEGPSDEAVAAAGRLLAWRLDVAHIDPEARIRIVSSGNDRFESGKEVEFPAIASTGDATGGRLPGPRVEARLPDIRARAGARGGLQILDPTLTPSSIEVGTDGKMKPIRFRAKLTRAADWHVVIATKAGTVLADLTGSGETVDATWTGPGAGVELPPAASLVWSITAGNARPATGGFDGSGGPVDEPSPGTGDQTDLVASVVAAPAVITPNGDGVGDSGRVTWRQIQKAVVRVVVVSDAGAEVAVLDAGAVREPGAQEATWDGAVAGGVAASGHYRYRLLVQPAGSTLSTAEARVDVRRGGGSLTASPVISPNGDGVGDAAQIEFARSEPGDAIVRVLRRRKTIATIANLFHLAGPFRTTWDGAGLNDGVYRLQVIVPTDGGQLVLQSPIRLDTTGPKVTGATAELGPRRLIVKFRLNEAAHVLARVRGTVVDESDHSAGAVRLRIPRRAVAGGKRVRILARDAAGNPSLEIVLRFR